MKKSLVVIPFDIPWDWSTDYTNQTAIILSKKHKVLCLLLENSFSIKEYFFSKKKPRLFQKHARKFYLYRPIQIVPFRRFKAIHNFNINLNLLFIPLFLALSSLTSEVKQKLLWIFHPKLYPTTKYFDGDFKIIYDCVDFFDYGTDEKEAKRLRNYEERLAKKAHFVTANSNVLLKRLKKMRKDVHLVPQGFRIRHFEEYKKKKKSKIKLEVGAEKPIIGFAGGINYRLDFYLLKGLVHKNPQWTFVLWGPVQIPEKGAKSFQKKLDSLTSHKNVVRGVFKERKNIPSIIDRFDVAIIPYDKTLDFNRYCYPMKLFEYFYLGKPVVSTPIEELKRFPELVKIGEDTKEWEKIIKNLLSKNWPEPYKTRQKKLAKKNSWGNKVQKILDLL